MEVNSLSTNVDSFSSSGSQSSSSLTIDRSQKRRKNGSKQRRLGNKKFSFKKYKCEPFLCRSFFVFDKILRSFFSDFEQILNKKQPRQASYEITTVLIPLQRRRFIIVKYFHSDFKIIFSVFLTFFVYFVQFFADLFFNEDKKKHFQFIFHFGKNLKNTEIINIPNFYNLAFNF